MASPDAPSAVVAGATPPVAPLVTSTRTRKLGRAHNGVATVPPATVGGVTVGRHVLEVEAERLQLITARVGKRLVLWLRRNPEAVPGEEFTEIFRYYQASVIAQLREQRERYKQAGGEGMSTEALEAQFRMEVLLALRTFTEQDWAVADKVRAERFGGGAWVQVVEGKSEEKP